MKVYFKTILMLIKMQLEYRKAFIISVIGSFFVTFLLTLSVFWGKVMQTVEKEQVVSVQLLSESRRG